MKPVTDPTLVAELNKIAQPAPQPRSYGGPALPDRIPTTPMMKPPKHYGQAGPGVQVSPEGKREADPTRTLLSPDAQHFLGEQYGHTGTLPSMGMGGRADRVAIINQGIKAAKRDGIDPAGLNERQLEMRGLSVHISQLHRIMPSVLTAEETAKRNGKMLLDMVRKSNGNGTTGVPLLNSVQMYAKKQGGDAAVVEFKSSRKLFATEFARVMSGGGNGPLSDSARHEVDELIADNLTAPQFIRLLARMQVEMENRRTAFQHELDDAHHRVRALYQPAGKKAATAPQGKPTGQMQIRVISRRKVG